MYTEITSPIDYKKGRESGKYASGIGILKGPNTGKIMAFTPEDEAIRRKLDSDEKQELLEGIRYRDLDSNEVDSMLFWKTDE